MPHTHPAVPHHHPKTCPKSLSGRKLLVGAPALGDYVSALHRHMLQTPQPTVSPAQRQQVLALHETQNSRQLATLFSITEV